MNHVAAGGVVALAWYRETDGREVPLIRASDLEACQQALKDASDCMAMLSDKAEAAQAEADRLRVDADRYAWLRTNADYVMISWDDAHRLEGPIFFDDALIDAAIHAAKTEQERGE